MKKNKISFLKRISFRVTSITIFTLLLGIGILIFYYLNTNNATLIESREKSTMQLSEFLHIAIRNNMLAGEAPIAVELFEDFSNSDILSDVLLYRADGTPAFSDESTIKSVNSNIGIEKFIITTRSRYSQKLSDDNFNEVVTKVDDKFIRSVESDSKSIIVYKPLINQPKCSACHGLDHVIRGVIKISTPIDDVYTSTRNNTILSAIIYFIVVFILAVLIIVFINRVIIRRIFHIGLVVNSVGEGDLSNKITVKTKDEIGELSTRINNMIDGLKEKLKLSKFVSKSTLEHVKSDQDISLGGEKKEVTVLFTDIRGFTSFSEKRDPEEVMEILNNVMDLQSKIILKYNGDIDKFVGDEIMAVFEGDEMSLRAIQAAEEIRNAFRKLKKENPDHVAVGIGINTGTVIAGNMGALDRIDRTVIGDTVNLGARLCSSAGGNVIVVSEFTVSEVGEKAQFKEHKPIKVKGKEKPVKIYTLRSTIK